MVAVAWCEGRYPPALEHTGNMCERTCVGVGEGAAWVGAEGRHPGLPAPREPTLARRARPRTRTCTQRNAVPMAARMTSRLPSGDRHRGSSDSTFTARWKGRSHSGVSAPARSGPVYGHGAASMQTGRSMRSCTGQQGRHARGRRCSGRARGAGGVCSGHGARGGNHAAPTRPTARAATRPSHALAVTLRGGTQHKAWERSCGTGGAEERRVRRGRGGRCEQTTVPSPTRR